MSITTKANREPVKFVLIDNDSSLPTQHSLVHEFDSLNIDAGEEQSAREQLIADSDMQGIIAKHNAVRAKEINLSILNNTGREVKLQPIKLRDLTWMAK